MKIDSSAVKHRTFTKRPLPLLILNVLYFTLPIYYIVVFFFMMSRYNSMGMIVYNVVFFLIFMTMGTLCVAFLLIRLNVISWWAVLVHSGIVLIHNFIVVLSSPDLNLRFFLQMAVFQPIMIFLVVYVIAIHKDFRVLFFNPRLRWWESKPRYKISVNSQLTIDGVSHKTFIDNISVDGVQFHCGDNVVIGEGDSFKLDFSFDDLKMSKEVEVVWVRENEVGARFINLSKEQSNNIKSLIKSLRRSDKRIEGR